MDVWSRVTRFDPNVCAKAAAQAAQTNEFTALSVTSWAEKEKQKGQNTPCKRDTLRPAV